MAHSVSTELGLAARQRLLALARQAISGHQPPPEITAEAGLGQCCGVFVTLKKHGELRGCIGQLEARQPLPITVADCAAGAAFRDPRFPALQAGEVELVTISIAVLSPPLPLAASDRSSLLAQLQPGIDGLVIAEGERRATFLPSVWEQLPDRSQFLSQLLAKAGLPADYWSDELACSRYTSCNFSEPPLTGPRSPARAGSR
ncbi:AmmeMemoRadiSam system protein A [Seongchinamella sediminis]|uniref:AmmeMemoRadiSam system protein A n=1 Tax=Seongchinamella sediminis TaxID=2283635 RepID=A0A3L7E2K5_9GAMM|nr:AmmeMemoRadiSam system protein A [Seongchinamella sediminis]RLQ22442.1 AmmeMemoRadiSam system protein A [Seongchinamella sediminis]